MKKKNNMYIYLLFIVAIIAIHFTLNNINPFDAIFNHITTNIKMGEYADQTHKYTAVIIEPRKHSALEFVLNNFLENLDERWDIILFHGNLNKEYAEDIIETKLQKYKDRIKLVNLKIDDMKSHYEYSSLLISKELYDHIPTEMFLVFQTDTVICSKYKDYIYKFMEYDYVGSPTIGPPPWNDEGAVGNGGLSLRRKSKMVEIIDKCKVRENDTSTYRDDLRYEDLFFAFPCDKVTEFKKPNIEDAKEFAMEKIYSEKTFGLHKAYAYQDVNKIKMWCPEISKLQELQ